MQLFNLQLVEVTAETYRIAIHRAWCSNDVLLKYVLRISMQMYRLFYARYRAIWYHHFGSEKTSYFTRHVYVMFTTAWMI